MKNISKEKEKLMQQHKLISYLQEKINEYTTSKQELMSIKKKLNKMLTNDKIYTESDIDLIVDHYNDLIISVLSLSSITTLKNLINVISCENFIFCESIYCNLLEFVKEENEGMYLEFRRYIRHINKAKENETKKLDKLNIVDYEKLMLDIINSNKVFLETIEIKIQSNKDNIKFIKNLSDTIDDYIIVNVINELVEEKNAYIEILDKLPNICKSTDIIKLYNFIKYKPDCELTDKQIEIFKKMPFAEESAIKLLEGYIDIRNKNILERKLNKKEGKIVNLKSTIKKEKKIIISTPKKI